MLAQACCLPDWLCLCKLCDAYQAMLLPLRLPVMQAVASRERMLRLAACVAGSGVVTSHCVPPLQLPLLLQAIDRRERLRRLALETIDLTKDPYFMRNHLGQYECRLCLTLHNNEGNYLAHTQVGS